GRVEEKILPARSHLPPECTGAGTIRSMNRSRGSFSWQPLRTFRGVAPQDSLPPGGQDLYEDCTDQTRAVRAEMLRRKRVPARGELLTSRMQRVPWHSVCECHGTQLCVGGRGFLPRGGAAANATSARAGTLRGL